MHHFYFIFLLTCFVLILNYATGNYDKLRKDAARCTKETRGLPILSYDGCNTCKCLDKGLLKCSTIKKCDVKKDELPQQDSKAVKLKTYKKLKYDAISCKPGETTAMSCIQCKCIVPGVVQCSEMPKCRYSDTENVVEDY